MKTKQIFFALAFFCLIGLNFSCEKETVAETDDLISIEKKDIKEEDT